MSPTAASRPAGQPPPNTRYEDDIAAWADEQAALLRAGRLDEIDIANIAEEIEDVGLAGFPEQCPWAIDQVLREDWLP